MHETYVSVMESIDNITSRSHGNLRTEYLGPKGSYDEDDYDYLIFKNLPSNEKKYCILFVS